MDELLSQLRSKKDRLPTQHSADGGMPKRACNASQSQRVVTDSVTIEDQDGSTSILDITTSEAEKQPSFGQLGFELLKRSREAHHGLQPSAEDSLVGNGASLSSPPETGYVTAFEVSRLSQYRIHKPFWGMVKGIERFGSSVCRWEMCDETGTVFGSTCVHEDTAAIGDVVCLENCGVWRLKENHLNIVPGNIKKVIRRK